MNKDILNKLRGLDVHNKETDTIESITPHITKLLQVINKIKDIDEDLYKEGRIEIEYLMEISFALTNRENKYQQDKVSRATDYLIDKVSRATGFPRHLIQGGPEAIYQYPINVGEHQYTGRYETLKKEYVNNSKPGSPLKEDASAINNALTEFEKSSNNNLK